MNSQESINSTINLEDHIAEALLTESEEIKEPNNLIRLEDLEQFMERIKDFKSEIELHQMTVKYVNLNIAKINQRAKMLTKKN